MNFPLYYLSIYQVQIKFITRFKNSLNLFCLQSFCLVIKNKDSQLTPKINNPFLITNQFQ